MKIVIYKDKKGEFRAKIVAANGRILFETSESYKRRAGVENAVRALRESVLTIVDETKP